MKRTLCLLLICLVLTGCGDASLKEPVTVEQNGVSYTVDPDRGEIFDGTSVYVYEILSVSSGYDINLLYPDNSTWSCKERAGNVEFTIGGSYGQNGYADGAVLRAVLLEAFPTYTTTKSSFFVVFLVVMVGSFFVSRSYRKNVYDEKQKNRVRRK